MGTKGREQTSGMATFKRRMKESTGETDWKVLSQKVKKWVSESGRQGRRRCQGHQHLMWCEVKNNEMEVKVAGLRLESPPSHQAQLRGGNGVDV